MSELPGDAHDPVDQAVAGVRKEWEQYFANSCTEGEGPAAERYLGRIYNALVDLPDEGTGRFRNLARSFLNVLSSSFRDQTVVDDYRSHFDELLGLTRAPNVGLGLLLGEQAVRSELGRMAQIVRGMMKCAIVGIAHGKQDGLWQCIALTIADHRFDWCVDALSRRSLEVDIGIPLAQGLGVTVKAINLGRAGQVLDLHDRVTDVRQLFKVGLVAVAEPASDGLCVFALGPSVKGTFDFDGNPSDGDASLLEIAAVLVLGRFRQFGSASMFTLVRPTGNPAAFMSGNLRAFKSDKRRTRGDDKSVVELLRRYYQTVHASVTGAGGHVLDVIGDNFIAGFHGADNAITYASALSAGRDLRARWAAYDTGGAEKPELCLGISSAPAQVFYVGCDRRFFLAIIGLGISRARLLQRCAPREPCAILVDALIYDELPQAERAGLYVDADWEHLWAIMRRYTSEEQDMWPMDPREALRGYGVE